MACIWGLFNAWLCPLFSMCQCACESLHAERPRGIHIKRTLLKGHNSFLFVQCRMWRCFAIDWGLQFWPEVGNKSDPVRGQSRGLYIALEPCELCLLVGKTLSTVLSLTLTRCCQEKVPQTDIHVNKTAHVHKLECTINAKALVPCTHSHSCEHSEIK